jgi:TolB-like protein
MAHELREVPVLPDLRAAVRAVAITRLIVLPFRVLRPDPETDFLAFSLSDAIASSLSGLDALVVRSSLSATRFAGEGADLKRIATEAEIDVALTGTLLRSDAELRVSTQLVEAPSGTLIWSQTNQVTLQDIFQLQDSLVQRIVEALALPLTTREHRLLRHDVSTSPVAYEFYLRGNQLIQQIGLSSSESFSVARDLYLRCLEEDSGYAPAWARLGRCHRLLAKAGEEPAKNRARAEASLKRAIELNPGLTLAHKLYAQLETELGHPVDAVARLLRHAHPGSADPELFSGLVHACRYCGLLEASVASHERARRLDSRIPTGVRHTYWLLGQYDRALAEGANPPFYFEEESITATETALALFDDQEARYYLARQLARLGARERALQVLFRVVEQGFHCSQAFARDTWLDSLRDAPEFTSILQRAERSRREAAASFIDAGGERLLGVRPAS